jgi:hypothetical protein
VRHSELQDEVAPGIQDPAELLGGQLDLAGPTFQAFRIMEE